MVRSTVEYALGDRQALILTDARMGNPGLLNIFSIASSAGSRKFSHLSSILFSYFIETDVPLQSIVMPGSRATCMPQPISLYHVLIDCSGSLGQFE
jgi:hypothetical protein